MNCTILGVAGVCIGTALMLTTAPESATAAMYVGNTPIGPVLSRKGTRMPPVAFQVGFQGELATGQSEIKWAGQNGVSIISPAIWGMPWFRDGEEPTLDGTDIAYWLDGVLAANPNALLMPRFPVDQPPAWWEEQHPGDMMLFDDGTKGIASVHSRVWRRDAAKQIGNLVRLLEKRYGDRMIGYHICGQNSAEWFYDGFWDAKHTGFEPAAVSGFREYLKSKYGSDAALRSAWNNSDVTLDSASVPTVTERTAASAGSFRNPTSERKAIDFDEFQNIDMADAIAEMCKAVKDAAPNRLAIAFYGYTFELSGSARSGHLALSRLLKSPYVDGICAPYSYVDRQPGGSGRFMGPVDSVLAAGKMWFTEDDTRTYLTDSSAFPGRCSDSRQTKGVLTRNFSHILTRGAGLWWMEPIGTGWWANEDLCKHLGQLTQVYQANMFDFSKYSPEIAVIVDEPSCLYFKPFMDGSGDEGAAISLLTRFRQHYYRIGAPVGMYLFDDLISGRVPPAKMYIFLNTFKLDDAQLSTIRSSVCNSGRVVVWMYAPGIIGGNALSPGNVSKVAGINIKEIGSGDGNIILEGSGAKFSAEHGHLVPTFAVNDADSVPIAKYASGEVCAAMKSLDNYTSVYCGALQLPPSVLRALAARAGVHIYNDQDQVIAAGNGFVAIHATSDGKKTLHLPAECLVYDALTSAEMGRGVDFTFGMRAGDTRLIRIKQ